MEENTVVVTVKMSEEDYCNLQEWYISVNQLKFKVFSSAIVMMLVMTMLLKEKLLQPMSLLIFLCMIGCIIFYLIVFSRRHMKKLWIEQFQSSKEIQAENTYIFKPEGIERTSKMNNGRYDWSDLFAYIEREDSFIIFTSNTQCFCIPKNRFNDNSQISMVRRYLENLPIFEVKDDYKKKFFKKARRYIFIFLLVFLVLLGMMFLRIFIA